MFLWTRKKHETQLLFNGLPSFRQCLAKGHILHTQNLLNRKTSCHFSFGVASCQRGAQSRHHKGVFEVT